MIILVSVFHLSSATVCHILSVETEPVTSNLVLSQFEKVGRTKNKWKCAFKDGIMLLNGSEYVFGKATAEFLW